jgi:hypothetical protein
MPRVLFPINPTSKINLPFMKLNAQFLKQNICLLYKNLQYRVNHKPVLGSGQHRLDMIYIPNSILPEYFSYMQNPTFNVANSKNRDEHKI